jgi:hypothetical protein
MNSGDSAVAERLARLLDCRVQPVLEVDESIPLPRALPQFLPRDELPRAFEERDQDLERLLLQAEPGATTEQLTGHRIELESAEAHARGPQGGRHRLACAQCSRGGRTGQRGASTRSPPATRCSPAVNGSSGGTSQDTSSSPGVHPQAIASSIGAVYFPHPRRQRRLMCGARWLFGDSWELC